MTSVLMMLVVGEAVGTVSRWKKTVAVARTVVEQWQRNAALEVEEIGHKAGMEHIGEELPHCGIEEGAVAGKNSRCRGLCRHCT